MISYVPGRDHDMLLASWWAVMDSGEDLKMTFSESCHNLSGFLSFFQRPRILFFGTDQHGIDIAVWFEPLLSGAFAGFWVAPHKRRSPSSLKKFEMVLDAALKYFTVIIGVTKQERLIAPHRRMGYELLGKMPGLFDGEDAWVLTLTRGGFDGRRRREKRPNQHVAKQSA